MKSYTDLEQSKVLSKILPLESADMEYMFLKEDNSKVSNIPFVKDDDEPEWPDDSAYDFIPCWSLAALLDVIPKRIKDFNVLRIDISEKDFSIWYDEIGYGVNTELPDITMEFSVDACVEMIVKLKEKNLI